MEASGAAGAITAAEVIRKAGGQTNIPTWDFVHAVLKDLGLDK